jgi:hypothetical protein
LAVSGARLRLTIGLSKDYKGLKFLAITSHPTTSSYLPLRLKNSTGQVKSMDMPDPTVRATLQARYGLSELPRTATDLCSCIRCMELDSRDAPTQEEFEYEDDELSEIEFKDEENIGTSPLFADTPLITIVENSQSDSIILTFATSGDTGAMSLWAGKRGEGCHIAHLITRDAEVMRERQEAVRVGDFIESEDLEQLQAALEKSGWEIAVKYGLLFKTSEGDETYQLIHIDAMDNLEDGISCASVAREVL